MELLLDTHVFLWWLNDSPELGPDTRVMITDLDHFVFVSAATAWEIAVKRSTGKLDFPGDIRHSIETNNFMELETTVEHAVASAELPRHHKDPFDRLLIAQARVDRLMLVARDDYIEKYDVTVFDAST